MEKSLTTVESARRYRLSLTLHGPMPRSSSSRYLGRPNGTVVPQYSLAPVAQRMTELTDISVTLAEDVTGISAQDKAAQLEDGQILLIENVRFDARDVQR